MYAHRYQVLTARKVTLHDGATTLPAPTTSGAGGGDVTGWSSGHQSHPEAEIAITAAGAVTLSDVRLLADDGSSWLVLGSLDDMELDGDVGRAVRVVNVGHFERLALSATLSAAVAVTVKASPVERAG